MTIHAGLKTPAAVKEKKRCNFVVRVGAIDGRTKFPSSLRPCLACRLSETLFTFFLISFLFFTVFSSLFSFAYAGLVCDRHERERSTRAVHKVLVPTWDNILLNTQIGLGWPATHWLKTRLVGEGRFVVLVVLLCSNSDVIRVLKNYQI